MTVDELIAELRKYPPDTQVWADGEDHIYPVGRVTEDSDPYSDPRDKSRPKIALLEGKQK